MADEMQNSPIRRWIFTNKGSEGFDAALQKLMSFACADWIRREAGVVLPPEEALAKVVSVKIPGISLGEWMDSPQEYLDEIAVFCEKSKILPLPESLKGNFPDVLDLRGVVCPRNAARSRLVMAGAPAGHRLHIYLDEGSPIENVPQALVADGHIVENRQKKEDFWVLTVVKRDARV